MTQYEQETTFERFRVDDDQKALWCIRKINQEQTEYERLKEHYKRELEKAKSRLENTRTIMLEMLSEYMVSGIPLHETKTLWSYSLPGAKLKLTKPSKVIIHDDEKLLPALHEAKMDEYIKITESVNWADLKKRITETGELFDGISVEEKPGEIKIEMTEE